MQSELIKSYEPEFTQLPFNFLAMPKNIGLRKLIRTLGIEYLSYFVVIQDVMAGFSDKDFTLSIDEIIDALRENLYLYEEKDEDIEMYIDNLFNYEVIVKRKIYNFYTQNEEERYCIASVADSLEDAREAWFSKCINPMKLSKEEKVRVKTHNDKINEYRKEVRQMNGRIDFLNLQLTNELNRESINRNEIDILRSEIKLCEEKKKELYKQIHVNQNMINKIKSNKGGCLECD